MEVFDAAAYIINNLKVGEESTVTNLALNKLLYFAQGHYLAESGDPLFRNAIEAWDFGPVVPEVYHRCKKYGDTAITPDWEYEYPGEFDRGYLDGIIREYGKFSVFSLVAMSHASGTPWDKTCRGSVIEQDDMKEYFKTCLWPDEDEDSEFCRMLADETPEDDGYRISHEDLLAKYGI
jgi:uncharacterized phage-associated protein